MVKMGRTKKFDEEKALDWMMNEIWRNGFKTFSVKGISGQLGITRSSFFNSFESREAVFLKTIARYSEATPHENLKNYKDSGSPLKHLTDVFRDTCLDRTNDPEHRGCMVVNSVSELVGGDNTVGPIIAKNQRKSIAGFEKLLKHSIQQGDLPENTNTRDVALALQNLLLGLNTMSKIVTSEKELWSATQTTLRALGVYRE